MCLCIYKRSYTFRANLLFIYLIFSWQCMFGKFSIHYSNIKQWLHNIPRISYISRYVRSFLLYADTIWCTVCGTVKCRNTIKFRTHLNHFINPASWSDSTLSRFMGLNSLDALFPGIPDMVGGDWLVFSFVLRPLAPLRFSWKHSLKHLIVELGHLIANLWHFTINATFHNVAIFNGAARSDIMK